MSKKQQDKDVYVVNEQEEKKKLNKNEEIQVDDERDEVKIVNKFEDKKSENKSDIESNDPVDMDIDEEEIENLTILDDDTSHLSYKPEDLSEVETQIKNIVFDEFSKLIDTIEQDFAVNFNKKRHNFLLSQLEDLVTATMVFVSSFESKSGYAIERVAEKIAQLKYGEDNVPSIVNPKGLKHDLDPKKVNGQIIVSDIDLANGDLNGKISAFRANNVAKGRGKNRVESGVTQQSIQQLLPIGQMYRDNNIYIKPVDLAFYDGKDWNILELKAGGDLDSSNAPSNIEKLLSIYTGLNVKNAKIYFATLYNKDGEGNTWKGAVKKHMAYPEMFLIGKNLWEKILPEDISFERFTELYKFALEDIDLNKRIREMIRIAVK